MVQLSYQEALEKARRAKSRINHCIEYTNAYAFEYAGSGEEGGDAPVVIMKDTGEALNFIAYAVTPGKEVIRDYPVK